MTRTLARLGFMGCSAMLVGDLIMKGDTSLPLLGIGGVLLCLSLGFGFVADRVQAKAEARVSADLRGIALAKLQAMPARLAQSLPVGQLIVSMQRHPEAVAALVIGHRAASMMMGIGPLLAAMALVIVSWQAASMVIVLTPVMIIFFVLVGDSIRRLADAQEKAFGRLAGQFADRIRTLPTILANHAVGTEEAKLRERLELYAAKTMGVLRIAFLNAALIDFFASLSIAMLAVFLGLGHLKLAQIPGFSHLELWQSLFILMIAPDYFAPFRRFAEQYHAKAAGVAATEALDRLLNPVARTSPLIQTRGRLIGASDLPSRGLVAIHGPSGSGKSTLLRALTGVDPVSGEATDPLEAEPFAWIGTDSFVPAGLLREAIAWGTGSTREAEIRMAAGRVGLLDDMLLPGELDAEVTAGGGNLSGGQRLRIAIARALLTHRMVVADEPTAKLDDASAALVLRALRDMATERLVLIATHDQALLAVADKRIVLGDPASIGVAA